jgi:hypothetical protein
MICDTCGEEIGWDGEFVKFRFIGRQMQFAHPECELPLQVECYLCGHEGPELKMVAVAHPSGQSSVIVCANVEDCDRRWFERFVEPLELRQPTAGPFDAADVVFTSISGDQIVGGILWKDGEDDATPAT